MTAAVAGFAVAVLPANAHATVGSWIEYENGGPSCNVSPPSTCSSDAADAEGGAYDPGNLISATNGGVQAETTGASADIIYYWTGTGWSETDSITTYYPTDLFAPIGSPSPSDSLVVLSNNNLALQTWTGSFWARYGFGTTGISIAGNESHPYAITTKNAGCSSGNYQVEQYSGSSWSQVGSGCAWQVTVDVDDSNHYPWVLTAQSAVYSWNGSSWSNANVPTNYTPVKIAVTNGSVWGVDGSGDVIEWLNGASAWVNHSGDGGGPLYGVVANQISLEHGGTGGRPYAVFVVTEACTAGSCSGYDPETIWEWTPQTQSPGH